MVFIAFNKTTLGVILLIAFTLVDIISITCQIVPIPRFEDFFYLLKISYLASNKFQILIILLIMLLVANYFLIKKISIVNGKLGSLTALNITILLFLSNSINSEHKSLFYRASDKSLSSSQLINLIYARSSSFLESVNKTSNGLSKSIFKNATEVFFSRIDTPQYNNIENDKILLIINESWGVTKNEEIQKNIIDSIKFIGLPSIRYGVLDFSGATVSAELRELCKLQPLNFNLSNIENGFENCLPKKLSEYGYITHAIHGAIGLMYDRKDWYPKAGFQEVTFFESKPWPSLCYSFPGACDLDIKNEIPAFFSSSGKRFLYWLTLNTHSLYDKRDLRIDLFDCEKFNIKEASESCRNLELQYQFFHGLSEILKDSRMHGVEVLIVGDHTPIIFNGEEKQINFVENKVPWIHFKLN